MYTAVLPLQTLAQLEDTPAHRAGSVRVQQSQSMGQKELGSFLTTLLASAAPPLPA